jgi:RNA polymerase sigma-70 factor (ECF subfamily)
MEPHPPEAGETEGLLLRIEAGDRQAFEELFARHRSYLCQVVGLRMDCRLRQRVDPSDVVQDAQLEAFRRLDDFLRRRPMSFRLWLRKTACERLLMAQRRHLQAAGRAAGREVGLPDDSSLQLLGQFAARGSTPSQALSRAEKVRGVQEALTQLPEVDREILVLRNLEGLSNQETAEVLQIDPAAASQRYGRALLRLRKVLAAGGLLESPP